MLDINNAYDDGPISINDPYGVGTYRFSVQGGLTAQHVAYLRQGMATRYGQHGSAAYNPGLKTVILACAVVKSRSDGRAIKAYAIELMRQLGVTFELVRPAPRRGLFRRR